MFVPVWLCDKDIMIYLMDLRIFVRSWMERDVYFRQMMNESWNISDYCLYIPGIQLIHSSREKRFVMRCTASGLVAIPTHILARRNGAFTGMYQARFGIFHQSEEPNYGKPLVLIT